MDAVPGPDLLGGPPPTLLPLDAEVERRRAAGDDPATVAAAHPAAPVAWADLAEEALAIDEVVPAYAFARTGYHRGLDQLRRHGWKGHGPVPVAHEGNRGWLRCVAALSQAAAAIGETEEADRCRQLLVDSDPAALDAFLPS
jgi:hypothetical protein